MRLARHTFLAILLTAAARAADAPKLPYTIAKETTAITAPLRADGSPDYAAALFLLKPKDLTPENNAFALLLQIIGTENDQFSPAVHDRALQQLGIAPTPAGAATWQTYGDFVKGMPDNEHGELLDAYDELYRAAWKPADNTIAADFLARQQKLLDAAVQAAGRPNWWSPATSADPDAPLETLLPSLGAIRNLADALANRATLRAGAADFDGCLADIVAVKQIARHLTAGYSLIESLVGDSLNSRADETLGTLVATGALSPPQIARFRQSLAALPPLWSIAPAIDIGARWMELDVIERLSVGDAKTLASLEPMLGPLVGIERDQVDWDALLKHINAQFDTLHAILLNPSFRDYSAGIKTFEGDKQKLISSAIGVDGRMIPARRQTNESRDAYTQRVFHISLEMLMPSLGESEELHRRSIMQDEMVTLLLAAAESRAKTGAWPEKLDALAPAFIPSIPMDIYTQSPLRYLRTAGGAGEGPRIYSVGPNQKDEGGTHRTGGPAKSDDIGIGAESDQP